MKSAKIHLWTAEEIRSVVKLWSSTTLKDTAEKLGVSEQQVLYMVKIIRKERPDLVPAKHARGKTNQLVLTVLKEF